VIASVRLVFVGYVALRYVSMMPPDSAQQTQTGFQSLPPCFSIFSCLSFFCLQPRECRAPKRTQPLPFQCLVIPPRSRLCSYALATKRARPCAQTLNPSQMHTRHRCTMKLAPNARLINLF
jgi:hypothetical protein